MDSGEAIELSSFIPSISVTPVDESASENEERRDDMLEDADSRKDAKESDESLSSSAFNKSSLESISFDANKCIS